jgi:Flp pilus assembly protein TadG
MVEFALVAPIAFLFIIGILVVSVVVLHQNQLANTSRDIARAAAICGGANPNTSTTTLPGGASCTDVNVAAYAQAQLAGIDSSFTWTPTVTVTTPAGVSVALNPNKIASCVPGDEVHVAVTYSQSLYVPVVSNLFANAAGGVRTLSATGVATCEQ